MPEPTSQEKHPGAVVVRILHDKLDESNLSGVRAAISKAAEESPGDTVVLDMSDVSFMPSVSLGGLIQLVHFFRARKQRFVLASVQPSVREMLVLTRLDRIFEVQGSLPEFIASVNSARA